MPSSRLIAALALLIHVAYFNYVVSSTNFNHSMMLSTMRLVLFLSVLSFFSLSLIMSGVYLMCVFLSSDTTSYDNNYCPILLLVLLIISLV